MLNQIRRVSVQDHSVIPAEAEVRVEVYPGWVDTGTAVRGRLMGPRCRYASTVEVAYRFRPLLVPTGRDSLLVRAIIPEASLWEPECPHLYEGVVELWQNETQVDVVPLRHGLRHFAMGPRGLRVNGKVVTLRGREVGSLTEVEASVLRGAGVNLLMVPVEEATRSVWDLADRLGFLVLGRITRTEELEAARELSGHASALGWMLAAEVGGVRREDLKGFFGTEGTGGRFDFQRIGGELRAGQIVLGRIEE